MSPSPTPAPAKPSQPPNIYLIGAHCSGKTTLLEALKAHFESQPLEAPTQHPHIINEVVRAVMATQGFTSRDVKDAQRWLQLQQQTLRAQYAAEARWRGQDAWFVSDRSGLDPIVYADAYAGGAETLVETREWEACREGMRRGLVVLCEAGNADWLCSDDGVRIVCRDSEEWVALHERFVRGLREQGIVFVVLPRGVREVGERVRFVVEKMEERILEAESMPA